MSYSAKGDRTRQRVLNAALGLFRRRGYERTTMRDIAAKAGMSLGAAYHYYSSKEAMVLAYYQAMQAAHEQAVADSQVEPTLGARLDCLLQTKLGLLEHDRKLFAALFQDLAEPSSPLSLFGSTTRDVRDRSVAQFEELFADLELPERERLLLGRSVWLLHLALCLFAIHDRSRGQARSRRLASALSELVAGAAPWLVHPMAVPLRQRWLKLAEDVGFLEFDGASPATGAA
jgi:AcrR family transcriptional regulator